jgi:ribosomal protein L24
MVFQGGQATRVGYKKLEDGSKVRVSKKTNEEIEA